MGPDLIGSEPILVSILKDGSAEPSKTREHVTPMPPFSSFQVLTHCKGNELGWRGMKMVLRVELLDSLTC